MDLAFFVDKNVSIQIMSGAVLQNMSGVLDVTYEEGLYYMDRPDKRTYINPNYVVTVVVRK